MEAAVVDIERKGSTMDNTPDKVNRGITSSDDKYLDLRGLSAYSSVSIKTLRRYIKSGMPCFRLAGKFIVKMSAFDDWLNKYNSHLNQDMNVLVDNILTEMNL